MNQLQIQTQERQNRMLDKANFLVANKRVRHSPCQESRNIWMVGSYSTPKKWYVVKWDAELDGFICACKAFEFSSENMCLHIAAAAIYEGSNP